MRINVYDEEMTFDAELVIKEGVIGEDGIPCTFYGLRVYLKGADELHNTPFDDDRSAITFWSRNTTRLRSLIATLNGMEPQL
jgi:hypothetical protein